MPKEVRKTELTADFSLQANLELTDQIQIGLAKDTELLSGSGPLVMVVFDVKPDAQIGNYPISLSNLKFEGIEQVISVQSIASGIFTVAQVNLPPVVQADTANTSEDISIIIPVLENDTDPEGANLILLEIEQPENGTVDIDADSKNLIYVPHPEFNGEDSFTYTVSDGLLNSVPATVLVRVNAVNDPPTLADITSQEIDEDAVEQSLVLDVGPGGGSDETDQDVVVTARSSDITLIPDPTTAGSTLSYNPVADSSGMVVITVTVDDGQAVDNTTTKSFEVTVVPVNDAPELAAIEDLTVDEGQELTFELSARDVDGDVLHFLMEGELPSGAELEGEIFLWTPTYEQEGVYSLTFVVDDGKGASDRETVVITVNDASQVTPYLDPPSLSFGNVPAGSTVVDSLYLRNPNDVEATISEIFSSADVFSVISPELPVTIGAGGSVVVKVQFKPEEGVHQIQQAILTVSSSLGTATGRVSGREIWIGFEIDLDALDFGLVQVDNSQMDSLIISNPGNGLLEVSSITVSDGPFKATPEQFNVGGGASQVVLVEFTPASAGEISASLSILHSASEIPVTVAVSGRGANRHPVAIDTTVTIDEDIPQQITLIGRDPDEDVLTFSLVRQPSNGSVDLDNAAAVYAPKMDFNGEDSFAYTVSDGQAVSDTATVMVRVNAVNDPPTLADIAPYEIDEDAGEQSVILTVGPGGGSDEAAQEMLVTARSSNAALIPDPTLVGNTLSYTPAADSNGTVTITMTVDDGQTVNNTTTKSFEITVTPKNDVPVLAPIGDQAIDEGQKLTIELTSSDVDEDTFHFSVEGALPLGAQLIGATFLWTPTYEQKGEYPLTFVVNDPQGGSDREAISIAVNDAPIPEVLPSPTALNFGDIPAGSAETGTLFLKNPGSFSVTIDSLSSRSSIFEVIPLTFPVVIEPGDSVMVMVECTPEAGVLEVQQGTLMVFSSTGSVSVPLSGRGMWAEFEVEPDTLDFAGVRVNRSQNLTFLVSNPGNLVLEVTSTGLDTALFSVNPPVFNVEGGANQQVTVTFSPKQEKAESATLTLNSQISVIKKVTVRGEGVAPHLLVSPLMGDLTAAMGDTSTAEVTLYNKGSDTLRIESLSGLQPPFSVSPTMVDFLLPEESSVVTMSFSPASKGSFQDTLLITSDAGEVEHVVKGTGTGPIPVIESPFDFGEVIVGDTLNRSLPIRNDGNYALKIENIQTDNVHFTVDTTQFDVPAEDVFLLQVRFTPENKGIEEGTIFFTTNIGRIEALVIGEGIESNIAVHLVPPEFGSIRVGEEKSLKVLIENRGESNAIISNLRLTPTDVPIDLHFQPSVTIAPAGMDSVATLVFRPKETSELSGVTLQVQGVGIERVLPIQGRSIIPQLEFSSGTLVWKQLRIGASKTQMLEVRNVGEDTLHISEIRSSLSDFEVSVTELTVAPESNDVIEVRFTSVSTSAVEGRLIIISDAPGSPHWVTLRSESPPILQVVSPRDTLRFGDTFVFGVLPQEEREAQPLRLRNRGGGTLEVVLRSQDDQFTPEDSTLSLGADQEQVVQVWFKPDAIGLELIALEIHSNDPEVPLTILPMRGTGGGLIFEPPSVDFGEVVVGVRKDTTIKLINQSSVSTQLIMERVANGFGFDPQTVNIERGKVVELEVWFRAIAEGLFEDEIEVEDQGIEVRLSGTGVQGPDIVVSPSTGLDFRDTGIGLAESTNLTIQNKGFGPLKIYNLMTQSRIFQIPLAAQVPVIVGPGEERHVEVWFTPGEEGEIEERLTIVSNAAGDQRQILRYLKGRGVPVPEPPLPDIAVDGSLNFGLLEGGEEKEQSLPIRNIGEGVLWVTGIEASERQFIPVLDSLAVLPGESRTVQVKLKVDPAEGPEGVVRIFSNDPDQPVSRVLYRYKLKMPRFVISPDTLHFGEVEDGRRQKPLAIRNTGSAQGIVYLSKESGQFTFDRDRLIIEPGEMARTQVAYDGSDTAGTIGLDTNSPSQLSIPWEAKKLLELVKTIPENNSLGVERNTAVRLFFNRPVRRVGSLAGRQSIVGFQAAIVPEPSNRNWRQQIEIMSGNMEVAIPLELKRDQIYKLIVVDAEGQDGEPLGEPFELVFSTGEGAFPEGRIAGSVLFEDGTPVVGTVFLADSLRQLVGSMRTTSDGSYELEQIPIGSYSVFFQEESSGLSVSYDRSIQVNAGEAVLGVDIVVPLQSDELHPVVIEELIEAEATSKMGEGSMAFAVPIRTSSVTDLTGFTVRVSFDPESVNFLGVDANVPADSLNNFAENNVLYAAGGFPLFLTRIIDEGTIEYGGALLGATATTAPDDGGLLAYFSFEALQGEAEVIVDEVVRRTLEGEDRLLDVAHITFTSCCGADFNCDGAIDFGDFFLIADAFGSCMGDFAYDACMDLDGSGCIGFEDFFIFADAFGRPAAKPLVSSALGWSEQTAMLRSEIFQNKLHLEVGIADVAQNLDYGLLLAYEPEALTFEKAMSSSGGGLLLAEELQPGLLAIGLGGSKLDGAGKVEVRFLVHADNSALHVVEGVVREADGQLRQLRANVHSDALPSRFVLEPNYPNPFNPQTIIGYQLPKEAEVHLEIYDLLGQKVRTLTEEFQAGGYYRTVWKGRDDRGMEMASGVYFCRLQAGSSIAVRKLVLIK